MNSFKKEFNVHSRKLPSKKVRDWLTEKFQDRTISNKMKIVWPPKSPDMLPLDYWFWGACDQYIKETKPKSIEELMEHVSDYARILPKQDVYKAVMDIYKRVGCCWRLVVEHLHLG